MTAWISFGLTVRSTPRTISVPSSMATCRFLISKSAKGCSAPFVDFHSVPLFFTIQRWVKSTACRTPRRGSTERSRTRAGCGCSRRCAPPRSRSTRRSSPQEVGLHPNTVRSHLRVLAEAGLVVGEAGGAAPPGTAAPGLRRDRRGATGRRIGRLPASRGDPGQPSGGIRPGLRPSRPRRQGESWGRYLVDRKPPHASSSAEEDIAGGHRAARRVRLRPLARAGRRRTHASDAALPVRRGCGLLPQDRLLGAPGSDAGRALRAGGAR